MSALRTARDGLARVLRGERATLPATVRYLLTVVLCGAAFALRFAVLPADAGLAFLTFYPVVIAAALLFGTGPGLLAVVLCAASADYFFLQPVGSFAATGPQLVALLIFGFTGSLTCFLAHHLHRAVERLRDSEQRLRGLYEAPHVGIALTDMQGRYLQFNEAFRRICGYSADELRALDYWALTPPQYAAAEAAQLEHLKRTGRYGPYEKEYRRKDGRLVPLQLNGVLLRGRDGENYIWSIVEDITERRALETRLAAESARNRLFLRNASDGVHILDAQGHIVETSESFCAMLGYSRAELIGMHPSQWDVHVAQHGRRASIAELVASSPVRFTTVHRRKDGTTIDVEVTADRFEVDGAWYAYASARDVTEQKRLERAVLEAADREQRRLGHDLHDGLGQELTGISMLVGALASAELRAGRPAAAQLAHLESLIRRAIETCRAVARGLSPLGYAKGGLVEALEEMVSLQREAYGTDARFEVALNGPLRIGTDAADHLYRIAQEAVTNARRHGGATAIEITLEADPDTVRLTVADNGTGFVPPAAGSGGMGLRIMQYRAQLIGAQLTVGPGTQSGTRVRCECPQEQGGRAPLAAVR